MRADAESTLSMKGDASFVLFASPDLRLSLRNHAPLGLEELRLLCYALAAALPGGEASLPGARLTELFPRLTLSLALTEALANLHLLYELTARPLDHLLGRLFALVELREDGTCLYLEVDEQARAAFGHQPHGAYVAAPLPRPHENEVAAGQRLFAAVSAWRDTLRDLKPGATSGERRAPLELYGLLVRAFHGDAARLGGSYAPHTAILPAQTLRELVPAGARREALLDLLVVFMGNFPCGLKIHGQPSVVWAQRPEVPEDGLEVEVTPLGFDDYKGFVGSGAA